jgi:FKBP-type peptidyl-prolyl cis-trans isomerase
VYELALARRDLADLRAAYARLEQHADRLAQAEPVASARASPELATLRDQVRDAHERLRRLQVEYNDQAIAQATSDDELARRRAEQDQAQREIDRLSEQLGGAERALAAAQQAEATLAAALEKAVDRQVALEQECKRLGADLEQRTAELAARDRQGREWQADRERLRGVLAVLDERLITAQRERGLAGAAVQSAAEKLHSVLDDAAASRRVDRATIEGLEGLLTGLELRLRRADQEAIRLGAWLQDGVRALQPPPVAPNPDPPRDRRPARGRGVAFAFVVLLALVAGGALLRNADRGAGEPPASRVAADVRTVAPPATSLPPEIPRVETLQAETLPTEVLREEPPQTETLPATAVAALEASAAPEPRPDDPAVTRPTEASTAPAAVAAAADDGRRQTPPASAGHERIVSLPSGLRYRVLKEGRVGGRTPQPGDNVTVRYRGLLPDGREFDSSERRGGPVSMAIAQAVPGWREALLKMTEGAQWELYLPPALAVPHGATGARVAPDLPLTYRLELVAIQAVSGR